MATFYPPMARIGIGVFLTRCSVGKGLLNLLKQGGLIILHGDYKISFLLRNLLNNSVLAPHRVNSHQATFLIIASRSVPGWR